MSPVAAGVANSLAPATAAPRCNRRKRLLNQTAAVAAAVRKEDKKRKVRDRIYPWDKRGQRPLDQVFPLCRGSRGKLCHSFSNCPHLLAHVLSWRAHLRVTRHNVYLSTRRHVEPYRTIPQHEHPKSPATFSKTGDRDALQLCKLRFVFGRAVSQ